MGHCVGCTHSKGSVQHSSKKYQAVTAVPGLIQPFFPDKITGGVCPTTCPGHDSESDKADHPTAEDECEEKQADVRNVLVCVEQDEAVAPSDDEENNEDLPALGHKLGMVQGPELENSLSDNDWEAGTRCLPGEVIHVASVVPIDAAKSASCDGCPLINCYNLVSHVIVDPRVKGPQSYLPQRTELQRRVLPKTP